MHHELIGLYYVSREKAPYLFLGGPLDAEIEVVDIREDSVIHPHWAGPKEEWVVDHDGSRLLLFLGLFWPSCRPLRKIMHSPEIHRYVKKQVVAEQFRHERSIPVFVHESILPDDEWLDLYPTAVIHSLWPSHLGVRTHQAADDRCRRCGLCCWHVERIDDRWRRVKPCRYLLMIAGGRTMCLVYGHRGSVKWCIPIEKAIENKTVPVNCAYVPEGYETEVIGG